MNNTWIVIVYFSIGFGLAYGLVEKLSEIADEDGKYRANKLAFFIVVFWPLMIFIGIIEDKL